MNFWQLFLNPDLEIHQKEKELYVYKTAVNIIRKLHGLRKLGEVTTE